MSNDLNLTWKEVLNGDQILGDRTVYQLNEICYKIGYSYFSHNGWVYRVCNPSGFIIENQRTPVFEGEL